jgi:hypothetical protein
MRTKQNGEGLEFQAFVLLRLHLNVTLHKKSAKSICIRGFIKIEIDPICSIFQWSKSRFWTISHDHDQPISFEHQDGHCPVRTHQFLGFVNQLDIYLTETVVSTHTHKVSGPTMIAIYSGSTINGKLFWKKNLFLLKLLFYYANM